MATPLTWRVYRDEAQAPIPVLRRRLHRQAYRFLPVDAHTGDTALVQEYITARGLYTGRVWRNGYTLPSAVMRDEPVLLDLKMAYGSRTRILAVADDFLGEGPNPYLEPRLVSVGDTVRLLIPPHPRKTNIMGGVIDTGDLVSKETFAAEWLGERVYKIPAGFPDLHYIHVAGEQYTGTFWYDPYHGALLLDDVVEGRQVHVTVKLRYQMTHYLPLSSDSVQPVVIQDRLLGYLTRSTSGAYEDARRLPRATAGGGVDSMSYEGDALSTGHLWIIETTADPERLAAAVRRTLPAGTLYRQQASYIPDRVECLYPAEGATVTAPVTFAWAPLEDAAYYQLQVASDPSFLAPELDVVGLVTDSYTTSTLTPGIPLYWRVRAFDAFGTTDWCVPTSFTASGTAAPGLPMLRTTEADGSHALIRTSEGDIVRVTG